MKILVFSTNGAQRDGITAWIAATFTHMDQSGFETIDTIAFGDVSGSIVEQFSAAGIRTHLLPSRRSKPLAYLRALRRLIRAHAYDVVHINGNSATVAFDLIACASAGARARIVHSHSTQTEHPSWHRILKPTMLMLCTDRVACGRDAGKWLFGERSFTVISNGREFSNYSFNSDARHRIRHQLCVDNHHVLVGHVGNFNTEKNHRFLLEAFNQARLQAPHLRLCLVGDGALRKELEEQIRQLDLQSSVTLVGLSPRVSDYLSAFDVNVLPSTHEGLPGVIIESQISGLPSLVSESVTDECALTDLVEFIPINNPAVWVSRMACAIPSERLISSQNAQALLKAAGYNLTDSARQLRSLYLDIERRQNPRNSGT